MKKTYRWLYEATAKPNEQANLGVTRNSWGLEIRAPKHFQSPIANMFCPSCVKADCCDHIGKVYYKQVDTKIGEPYRIIPLCF